METKDFITELMYLATRIDPSINEKLCCTEASPTVAKPFLTVTLLRLLYGSHHPALSTIVSRKATFTNWSRPEISTDSLAEAGFFYTGNSDVCTCFSCGKSLKQWTIEDVPLVEHRTFAPTCPFVQLMTFLNGQMPLAELFSNAKSAEMQLKKILNLASDNNIPFKIACQLDHDKDLVLAGILKRFFSNGRPEEQEYTRAADLVEQALDAEDDGKFSYQEGVLEFLININRYEGNESAANETHRLREENLKLLLKDICRICFKEKANHVIIPCGHLPVGMLCANKKRLISCPICNGPIDRFIKVCREAPNEIPRLREEKFNLIVNGNFLVAKLYVAETLLMLLYGCQHTGLSTIVSRDATFTNWPSLDISRGSLAEAGFFYTGNSDVCTCFACGESFGQWTENSLPLVDHIALSPTCPFVQLMTFLNGQMPLKELFSRAKSAEMQLKKILNLASDNSIPFNVVCQLDHDKDLVLSVILKRFFSNCRPEEQEYTRAADLLEQVLDVEDDPAFYYEAGLLDFLININRYEGDESAANETLRLRRENHFLFFKNVCRICFKEESNHVIFPCGHIPVGMVCANEFTLNSCPLCNGPVDRMEKIYRD